MKFSRKLRMLVGALALLAVLNPETLQACSSCFGQSDSRMAQGMNAGIFALLAIVGVVLGGIASFFVFIVRREAAMENEAREAPPAINQKA